MWRTALALEPGHESASAEASPTSAPIDARRRLSRMKARVTEIENMLSPGAKVTANHERGVAGGSFTDDKVYAILRRFSAQVKAVQYTIGGRPRIFYAL